MEALTTLNALCLSTTQQSVAARKLLTLPPQMLLVPTLPCKASNNETIYFAKATAREADRPIQLQLLTQLG